MLPEDMKHWPLTSLQTRLIKTGGRLVRHASRLVFQIAEVLVSRKMLTGILERIDRLPLAPGLLALRAPVFMTVMGCTAQIGCPKGATWAETSDSGLICLAGKWLPNEGGAIEGIERQLTRSECRCIVRVIQEGICSGKSI